MHLGDSSVPGLLLVPAYLGEDEQAGLCATVDRLPWRKDLKRRVQHYGYRYDYKRRTVDAAMRLGPLPDWSRALADQLRGDGYAPRELDQLIVNEYLPGQGISPHVDCVPCFTDTVLSLSLGSTCVLTMTRLSDGHEADILLEPGALLVLSGAARYEWKHGIAPRKTDRVDGISLPRGRRLSLTFRSVIESPSAQ
ncbi:alpha-ketoglutarate-dependent dioxygenase AlkB [Streptomyces sp. HPF1205]|uniref:alpha-ketoglutarate-dependent dioxygenase AlkB n=1 Tax=Streptomyces sp. HPF1205 TaxID=2873262 RepID=UPI001CED0632|nr:alpha-ketoglutarate-dependent dioxygenase AlkB [Streptomyces sp. HPF1205]